MGLQSEVENVLVLGRAGVEVGGIDEVVAEGLAIGEVSGPGEESAGYGVANAAPSERLEGHPTQVPLVVG